jgi:SulP family sulfate permease
VHTLIFTAVLSRHTPGIVRRCAPVLGQAGVMSQREARDRAKSGRIARWSSVCTPFVRLFGGQRLAHRFPWGLVVLLGGLAASEALDLQARGVAVVGPVPRGVPTLGLPSVDTGDLAAEFGAV